MAPLIVSACLLGEHCRYDGGSKPHRLVRIRVEQRLAQGGTVAAVCPEQLGGLTTPRPPAGLRGGDGHAVLDGQARVARNADKADVTAAFVQGALAALDQAVGAGSVTSAQAIVKARSPSCGCGSTWIDGAVRPGDGVFTALLKRHGITVQTEEDLERGEA